MKYARLKLDGEPRLALVDDQTLGVLDRDLTVNDLSGRSALPAVTTARMPCVGSELLIPVPFPAKIIAVGLNYLDHAAESTIPAPATPLLFSKTNNTLLPHDGAITVDRRITTQVDFEGELAVIVGRQASRVPATTALEHVFGYTIGNDISARDLQFSDGQWMRGKSLDTFCPLGPYMVTADEVPDPQRLTIVTRVNGAVMQEESTAAMIFSVAEIVSYVSHSITLEPGDVILTGTPAGVGFARTPPVFLSDGDAVTVTIEPIGTLHNTVRVVDRQARASHPSPSPAAHEPAGAYHL